MIECKSIKKFNKATGLKSNISQIKDNVVLDGKVNYTEVTFGDSLYQFCMNRAFLQSMNEYLMEKKRRAKHNKAFKSILTACNANTLMSTSMYFYFGIEDEKDHKKDNTIMEKEAKEKVKARMEAAETNALILQDYEDTSKANKIDQAEKELKAYAMHQLLALQKNIIIKKKMAYMTEKSSSNAVNSDITFRQYLRSERSKQESKFNYINAMSKKLQAGINYNSIAKVMAEVDDEIYDLENPMHIKFRNLDSRLYQRNRTVR